MTHIEKLDCVLKLLAKSKAYPTDGEIIKNLKDIDIIIPGDELNRILRKLIKDGYVEFEDREVQYTMEHFAHSETRKTRVYFISFDGYMLNEEDGYKALLLKKNKDNAQLSKLSELQIKQHGINRSILWANWIIAIGTLATVAFYIYQVFVNKLPQ